MTEKTVMVTGAAGFIARHLIDEILATTDWDIVAVARWFDVDYGPRVTRILTDLADHESADELPPVEAVFSLAADVDVARSLDFPIVTIENNVGIANTLVNYACRLTVPPTIVHVTTAEVFGPGGPHGTHEPPRPTNPYAASKAAQDAIFHAGASCYGIPLVVARTANVFGEYQSPDKFVPTVIRKLRAGEPIDMFGDAWRRWIYAGDVAGNLVQMTRSAGFTANITGARLISNADLVHKIAGKLNVTPVMNFTDTQRPGHESVYDIPPRGFFVLDDLNAGLNRMVNA